MIEQYARGRQIVRDDNNTKRLLSIAVVIALSSVCLSCFPDTYGGLQTFKEKFKDADEAELRGDFAAAEDYVREAERVARDCELEEQVLFAKMRIGDIQLARRQPDKAEATYLEAEAFCETFACDRIGYIYGDLLFLYVHIQKNPAKANEVLEKLRALPADRQDETVKEKIRQYSDECQNLSRSPRQFEDPSTLGR